MSGPDATDGATDGIEPVGTDDPVLAVEGLSVSYDRVVALRDVDLRVDPGEVVAVIGPNGAGKSTLAAAISGFHEYDGSVRFDGVEVAGRRPPDLVRSGLVHCTETRDLFGYMTVEDNLRLGAYRRGEGLDERLSFVYEIFPALAERTDQHARTMSGGEQQMLAVGRALMGDPDLLVLDEPTLGLAPLVRETIGGVLPTIVEAGVTVLLCEQNVSFALDHADRAYLLENGHVERTGTPETLRGDEYVREAYLGR